MPESINQKIIRLIGIWLLIGIGYSNCLTASWHLDDISNIVRNDKIHLSHFDADSLTNTFFASAVGKLYRPVAMASFALNWKFGGTDVFGYHLVNVLIHCINSGLLYLVVLTLLHTPRLNGCYTAGEIHWMAFLASVLWALNPVQIQAVTYIVQRMVELATLFYLLGIYAFLRYKKCPSPRSKQMWAGLMVCAYLLAILSKENAALFPMSIYFIIRIFFNVSETRAVIGSNRLFLIGIIFFSLSVGTVFFVLERGNPIQFIEFLYRNRPFSAVQRLMTESRVLILYLSQLFFPAPSRLSVCHDIAISTSLVTPWTTLPAILSLIVLTVISIVQIKRMPLIAFAWLFFMINHCVESTILPLELVFEHRNYLPSLFLFLPLSQGIVHLKRRPFFSTQYGRYVATGVILILIGLLCNWTFARNLTWQSEQSLWEDEISKNPQLARPYHNLAWGYYQARGRYEEAKALYAQALTKKFHSSFEKAITLGNAGRVHYLTGDYERAIHLFNMAIDDHPQPNMIQYQLIMALCQVERWMDAMDIVDSSLGSNDRDAFLLSLKGIILSKIGDVAGAELFLARSLKLNPGNFDARAHLSMALSRQGHFEEALHLLDGHRQPPPLAWLIMSEIERDRGNAELSDQRFEHFVEDQHIEKAREIILSAKRDKLSVNIRFNDYLDRLDAVQ